MARGDRFHGFAARADAEHQLADADADRSGIPIDHVAVNDDFEILSHRRMPNFESDHYGVLVELALDGTERP